MGDELLTPQEVAQMLRVTDRSVRSWATQGRLHGFKAGKDWRFTRAAVEEFIKANTPAPQPPKKAKALLAFA